MRVKDRIKLLLISINVIVCCAQYDKKSYTRKPTRRLTKLLKLNDTENHNFNHNYKCEHLPPTTLSRVLGAAFNSRYMSIDNPSYHMEDDTDDLHQNSYSTKRNSQLIQPFYVDDTFSLELSDKPAWEVVHIMDGQDRSARSIVPDETDDVDNTANRAKRDGRRGNTANTHIDRPWECNAKIKWIDLGPDYFPRFLRSVECTRKKCWYNNYICKPRSFTVKLLRRRNGECIRSDNMYRISNDDLPGSLKELWVWEERAVNFCCDCTFK